ncbi:MAG: iron transporter FeoB [Chloroflexi bacterium]|nr:MAG: iron transporter FeoB [Chloroflexota bacterium]
MMTTVTSNEVTSKDILAHAESLRWQIGQGFHDKLMLDIYTDASRLTERAVTRPDEKPRFDLDRTIDRIVTSRIWGFPLMILLFTIVFWLTIEGANVPSQMLYTLLVEWLMPILHNAASAINLPWWLSGFLIDGMYLATAWVISVMLPPMAIFFPLFTMLEDFGYLPRVAFNLDNVYRKAGAHGKQSLSMMMGFGCNAAGVIATRVIDSPRERLIAIITNNFALCNGRWPTQILLATIFIGTLAPAYLAGFISALAVVGIAILGVLLSFVLSWGLSRSVLRGEVSTFSLELPPYRPPRFWQTLYTSLIDRTLFVLWRAIVFALPAGAVIWLISNISINGTTIAVHLINFMEPTALIFGMTGIVFLAYIVAIPANEIVIPTILMLTVLALGATSPDPGSGAGVMFELDSEEAIRELLVTGGWTLLTAVNVMLFSLIHNPCSTTIYTIYKETGSKRWTIVSSLLPLVLGFIITFFVAQIWRLFS